MQQVTNTGLGQAHTQNSNIPVTGMTVSQKLKATDIVQIKHSPPNKC
jgi:hypothetical protein